MGDRQQAEIDAARKKKEEEDAAKRRATEEAMKAAEATLKAEEEAKRKEAEDARRAEEEKKRAELAQVEWYDLSGKKVVGAAPDSKPDAPAPRWGAQVAKENREKQE